MTTINKKKYFIDFEEIKVEIANFKIPKTFWIDKSEKNDVLFTMLCASDINPKDSTYWLEQVASGYKLWFKGVLYREYTKHRNYITCYFELSHCPLTNSQITLLSK